MTTALDGIYTALSNNEHHLFSRHDNDLELYRA